MVSRGVYSSPQLYADILINERTQHKDQAFKMRWEMRDPPALCNAASLTSIFEVL